MSPHAVPRSHLDHPSLPSYDSRAHFQLTLSVAAAERFALTQAAAQQKADRRASRRLRARRPATRSPLVTERGAA